MAGGRLDAIVVTTPANVRYFSGFASEFWQSPTRPWFVIVPRDGVPIAVVPEIGGPAFAETWIADIRTWPAPRPADDGVSLLHSTLEGLPSRHGQIGWEMGREMSLRMPVSDFDRLRETTASTFVDAAPLLWSLRMIKSPAEIACIERSCALACDAFDALVGDLHIGMTERQAANALRRALAVAEVDAVPFIAACSGAGGYGQIIVGSRDRPLGDGDVLFIDLGVIWDGYFCDFDRNFGFGHVSDTTLRAHDAVWEATEAGIAAARPGLTMAGLYVAMMDILRNHGASDLNVGRMGHGLGLQLTEPPSLMPGDDTVLQPGMVITIEPGLEFEPGKMIVHEENVVITETGCRLLTRRASRRLPIIDR